MCFIVNGLVELIDQLPHLLPLHDVFFLLDLFLQLRNILLFFADMCGDPFLELGGFIPEFIVAKPNNTLFCIFDFAGDRFKGFIIPS